ncbi:hypothetical protein [Brevundimonas sp. FT23042]|uniref:hypothetical protein n=1 Tax=Brevundimonas sp. FT23042 TaxID=3393749 RepID=UPI003B588DF1
MATLIASRANSGRPLVLAPGVRHDQTEQIVNAWWVSIGDDDTRGEALSGSPVPGTVVFTGPETARVLARIEAGEDFSIGYQIAGEPGAESFTVRISGEREFLPQWRECLAGITGTPEELTQ